MVNIRLRIFWSCPTYWRGNSRHMVIPHDIMMIIFSVASIIVSNFVFVMHKGCDFPIALPCCIHSGVAISSYVGLKNPERWIGFSGLLSTLPGLRWDPVPRMYKCRKRRLGFTFTLFFFRWHLRLSPPFSLLVVLDVISSTEQKKCLEMEWKKAIPCI